MGFIIAGLGNPGSQYEQNRHNIGFMLVDYLTRKHDLQWSRSKWDGLICRTSLWGASVCFIKPSTYMNRSGRTVAGVANYYNILPDNTLIVHDDIDMNVGRIKLVKGGGTGGHNGIRSIVQELGSADFYRLKIGIGRPGSPSAHPDMPVEKYVLSDFSAEEGEFVRERFPSLENGLQMLVKGDHRKAMNELNCLR